VVTDKNDSNELTAREKLIAEAAAQIAIANVTDAFYRQVGKTFINRFLILLGACIIGFGLAKGWITLPGISK